MLLTIVYLNFELAYAETYGGIEFSDGSVSFADEVITYNPGPDVVPPNNDPTQAIGIPDWSSDNDAGVSLGDEGILVLRFTDNSLTTSGDDSNDLWIFEVGDKIEPTAISISTDGINWIEVGNTTGATSGIDIDQYIGFGVILGQHYSYVKITDLLPRQSGSPYAGADIDALGAISSDSSCDDSDNDGVIDRWDLCPDTPADSCINKHGCLCEGLYTEEQMNQMVSNILTWGDTNNDGKIGLAEAIHALRITSGVTLP